MNTSPHALERGDMMAIETNKMPPLAATTKPKDRVCLVLISELTWLASQARAAKMWLFGLLVLDKPGL